MKKKFFTFIAMVMAFAFMCSFVACGGGNIPKPGGGDDNKIYDGEELFISMRLAGFGEWLNDYAEEFEEETGCKVTIDWNPSLQNEVRNIFASDSYVLDDLYFAGASDLVLSWAREGRLLELKGFDELLRDEMKDIGKVNGKRYTLDVLLPPMGLIYNQDYLDAIPTYGEYTQGQFPETFQGLLDLCDKVNTMGTINGVPVKPMSWGGQVDEIFEMYKMIWSQGNGGVDYENFINQQEAPVEEYFKSQSVKNALEGMLKLLNVEDGYSKNSILGCGEKDNIQQQQNFLNGECVFCPSGSWFKTEMKDSITSDTFEFGFAVMPLYNTEETTRVAFINVPTENFFIPAKAENAELAVEFLKFIFTPERCARIHKDLGTPLAFKYNFTEQDILKLDKYSQQVTNTVYNNRIVLRGSSNPLFMINATCGRFMNARGDQLEVFNGLANGTYTFSDVDNLMNESYRGFQAKWSEYRKGAGLN